MIELLAIVIPATLALIGTAVGIGIRYRQWRQERNDRLMEDYRAYRTTAYVEIWNKVEHVEILARGDFESETREALEPHIVDVNRAILRNSIYIDDQDLELIRSYLSSIAQLASFVEENKDQLQSLKSDWNMTNTLFDEIEGEQLSLALAYADNRQALIDRVRAVVRSSM